MAYTTIDDPEAYFQTVIYTGNGAANNAITLPADTDMQPDFVWIKNRDATDSHCAFDAVRGATKLWSPDNTNDETTDADTLDSFTSDGFQVDADVKVNTNTEDYVAWCWKESATSGFDIVTYTGTGSTRTISHSLSAVPHMMIFKRLDGGLDDAGANMYHHKNTAAPETDYLQLNSTAATADNAARFNDTAPTSSVFTLSSSGDVNDTDDAHVAYLFSEKQGFSKFGGYTGNGNADGTFVYTGFRPAFIITKKTSGTSDWFMFDNKRSGANGADPAGNHYVQANESDAETINVRLDILSNGFKFKTHNAAWNGSGATYIYIAFAEAPFVNSEGVPCNAR